MTKTMKVLEVGQAVTVTRGTMKGQTATVASVNGAQYIIRYDQGQGYGRTSDIFTSAALKVRP